MAEYRTPETPSVGGEHLSGPLANPNYERRLKILYVEQDAMRDLMARACEHDFANRVPSYFFPADFLLGVPGNVRVDAVHFDYTRRAFAIILASPEFSPVPCGQEIPPIPPVPSAPIKVNKSAKQIPVSLPPAVKTWEGKNAADAPGQESNPESPKEAAARRLQELTRKIERQEAAPRSEWIQARLDLGYWVEMNVCETTGRVNSYRLEFWAPAPPINSEAIRHILLFPGHRAAPAAGTIGILDGPGDFFAPEPAECIGSFDCNAGDHSDACPAKSEARLALEYDLRQALPVSEGGEIDRAISAGPDWLLDKATHYIRQKSLGHGAAAQELFAWGKANV